MTPTMPGEMGWTMRRFRRLWKRWKDAWHEERCGGGVAFLNLGGGNIEYTCKKCGRVSVDNPWKEIC
jgi:hypothetical protein